MKTMFKVLGSIVIATVLGFVFAGCPDLTQESEPGAISGRAFFTSGENHAGINVTLEKTDGLLSQSAVSAVRSIEQGALSIVAARSIAGATQTATNGSYTFSNVAPGTYTIYASSQNSKEKAVAVNNVTVLAGRSVTASDLKLTPVGSITGQILLDNNGSGNSGFLVSVAGTSFMAVTDDAGNFTISDVPANNGYLIVIIKGNYTTTWTGSTVTVTGGQTLTLQDSPLNITSEDMGNNGNAGLQWRGELASHPINPQLNWAYFNTVDRTSYIWNGSNWDILAAPGTSGSVISIGDNGNWFIDGVDTGMIAQGGAGAPGSVITIGDNGNWFIDGVDTGEKAQGPQGEFGTPGSIVTIGDNGNWLINGVDTGVRVQGQQGDPGSIISIGDNGNWFIDGIDTGKNAQGNPGAPGSVITIGANGNWFIDSFDTGEKAQGPQGASGSVITIIEGNWHIDGIDTSVSAIGQKGADGSTPVISIVDGYWHIDGVTTGVSAIGQKGADGSTPTISIVDGYWYVDGATTGVSAIGQKGADGSTPIISIVEGYWYVDGVTTGVSAIGQKGADGNTPVISIVDGYWYVDGVTTGVSAIGQKGADGSTPVISIVDGNWYIDGIDTGVSAIGLAGVSIVWKGELAEAPSSPQENWAYFNTTDRTSYIWNVTANKWDILAQSGSSTPQVPAATLILSDTKKIMYWPDEAFAFTDADIIGWLYNGHILTNLLDKTHNITLNGDPISNGDPVPTASGEYEIIVTHWSGRTSTFTITVNGTRTIVVDMYDSYSDGWNHNGALRVNINGTDQTVRLNSGGFGSQTLTVSPEDEINVYWTGSSGSYHNENAFIFYWEDAPPNPTFNATSWSGSNALLFRLRGSLSNANLNQLLGSFIITASGGVESLTTYTAANGSASTTTTQIILSFSADPVGLTIADITLGGSVTKGSATLSGSGTSRTISGFTVNSSGNATIAISRSGIESGQKNILVFLPGSGSLHEMVLIPAGTFTMGGNNAFNADPAHQVTLNNGFYMGKYQVTQKQWKDVIDWANTVYSLTLRHTPSNFTGENRPVETVSWYEAMVFCNFLSMKEDLEPAYSINGETNPSVWISTHGAIPTSWNASSPWNTVQIVTGSTGYRLPTEAQWEYACRAGTTTAYNTGDNITSSQANFNNNVGSTTAVGIYAPNAWGLYDMHGNVLEWCWDWYSDYTDTSKTDPVGASSGSARVLRGGSCYAHVGDLQSAYRGSIYPSYRINSIGFRVLRPYSGSIPTTYTATANGNTSTTTTQITLSFSADPAGLTITDIAFGGNITKGSATLSGNGTSRTISGFTVNSSGNATIAITRSGIESGQKIVPVFLAGSATPEMVWIPSGTFTMGSNDSSALGASPAHQVTLTSGFYMGKYQVTQKQWEIVMGTTVEDQDVSDWGLYGVGDNHPMYYVSWYDAIVFCNRLSIMEGLTPAYRINGSTNPDTWGAIPTGWNTTWNAVTIVSGSTGYRLPTEAQWEYACRAGTTTAYNTGNNITSSQANYNGNVGETSVVGSYAPNAWGLYDMHGNVWEWCWDWYDSYTNTVKTDPLGASSGSSRVLRGGGWSYTAAGGLQSADRRGYYSDYRLDFLGFRVLRP